MHKILVVDDDPGIRDMLRDMLEREHYQVLVAANGAEAIEVYATEPASVVITDIIMPEKEGIETIMELTRINPLAKIIAISGGGRFMAESYLEIAREIKAAYTFSKPFKRTEILDAIRQLTGDK